MWALLEQRWVRRSLTKQKTEQWMAVCTDMSWSVNSHLVDVESPHMWHAYNAIRFQRPIELYRWSLRSRFLWIQCSVIMGFEWSTLNTYASCNQRSNRWQDRHLEEYWNDAVFVITLLPMENWHLCFSRYFDCIVYLHSSIGNFA